MNALNLDTNDKAMSSAQLFQKFVSDRKFPCIGAHTAQAKDQINILEVGDLQSSEDDQMILDYIYRFIADFRKSGATFLSQVVIFKEPRNLNELEFENALWSKLQNLHELDLKKYGWAENVSQDPASKDFSFSLGGEAFYLVGLHPLSSRPARRFRFPAVVFNLHAQFEQLRGNGKYQPIRDIIRKRDIAFSGTPNPALADFGSVSEARQYSGRNVEEKWKCPFHPKN